METKHIGILHPGAMGASVAATVQNSGFEVWWLPEGRSDATRGRAAAQGFRPAETLLSLARQCQAVVSVCPPHAAEDVAHSLVSVGFRGTFIEANAISPQRTRVLAQQLSASGVHFVDGGILGLPAWKPGTTCLYLSGPRCEEVRELFRSGPLEARCLEGGVGRASALKMCYAGYTKGLRALLSAVLATAESLGVRQDLETHWTEEAPGFPEEVRKKILATSPKAWRWVAEMAEIADTFGSVAMPRGFHEASGEVYARLAKFRGIESLPPIKDFLEAVRAQDPLE